MNKKRKNIKHNYTNELELKSLLIRVKNGGNDVGTTNNNKRIAELISTFKQLKKHKANPEKRDRLAVKINDRVVKLSEKTKADKQAFELFGKIILLMIKNILRKRKYANKPYKDDFYSDSVYKVTKYLHNFDHTKISKTSGKPVSAFSYISQYIHNSIKFIIDKRVKDIIKHTKVMEHEMLKVEATNQFENWYNESPEYNAKPPITETIILENITSLTDELVRLQPTIEKAEYVAIEYPADYVITYDEYNNIKELLNGNTSLTRGKNNAQ